MDQNISNLGNSYLMRLQGVLSTPTIDWCGDVTITSLEPGGTLRLSLTIQADSLLDFLDQFQNFSLTVLPTDGTDPKNSARIDPM
jgi:hypothetical protein